MAPPPPPHPSPRDQRSSLLSIVVEFVHRMRYYSTNYIHIYCFIKHNRKYVPFRPWRSTLVSDLDVLRCQLKVCTFSVKLRLSKFYCFAIQQIALRVQMSISFRCLVRWIYFCTIETSKIRVNISMFLSY